ncbi:MAG: ATP-binding protein [Bdellovibrionota bacterium]
MIQTILWMLAIVSVGFVSYLLSYLRFRRMIAQQTKQMMMLMKAEDIDNLQIGNIYTQVDEDFSDLERVAMSLRKKYLRLRKLSQEERKGYETVFSGLKEGIVTVDQNLRIISFNASFMSFFNWAPLNEHSNYFLQDVIRDPQVISTFKKSFENSGIQKNEASLFQLFVTPLPSRNENESWCLGVFYDLSEIRKTEKIRIDFVANASHELRTPLTVIKGYSDLLKKKLEATNSLESIDLLAPILQSADQMSDLLDELLNLSKVEVGSSLLKTQISTAEITTDVLVEIENVLRLNGKKIIVENNVEAVLANLEAIKQVLRNLLINAIKYSGNSSEIKILWEQNVNSVILKVKDNGPGISKEHQDRIFERFYRVDKGRTRDQGGFGLGLALVKHHMINHGGSVKLISEQGYGSEFICEFPSA